MSRISRMTKERLDRLKAALEKSHIEYTDALKKEFVTYVNELSSSDYEKGDLLFHADMFAKTKATPAKKVTFTEPVPAKETRSIPRMTAKNLEILKKELSSAGVKNLEDEKNLKKLKDEFRDYLKSLTDDDYNSHDILDHMKSFATTMKTEGTPPESIPELDASDIEEIPQKEIEKSADRFIRSLKDAPTIAFDKHDGKWVGPAEDDDEDNIEIVDNSIKYAVGEKTRRVYRINPDGVGDTFLGFAGVGKFKHIKLPESDDELANDMRTLKV